MIVIFYYYPLGEGGRGTRREDPEVRRIDDLRKTQGRRPEITRRRETAKKRGSLVDDKKERKRKMLGEDREAICEEIVAARVAIRSRLMYGMLAWFSYVIAHNEIYAAVPRNYFLKAARGQFAISPELFSRRAAPGD